MLARVLFAALMLVAAPVAAQPGVAINARCAGELARDAGHVRTLRSALAQALSGIPADSGYTLDVSLVNLTIKPVGAELEVRAEVRAMLSDRNGQVKMTSSARSTARGSVRDRLLLQRDAVGAAAEQVARTVRTQLPRG